MYHPNGLRRYDTMGLPLAVDYHISSNNVI